MPYVRIGDKLHPIPWDADAVADLMYRGFEVTPDDGIDEATYKLHNSQLYERLRRKWGNKNFNAGTPQASQSVKPQPPSIVAGEGSLQGFKSGIMQNILPNPNTKLSGMGISKKNMIDLQDLLNFNPEFKKPIDL